VPLGIKWPPGHFMLDFPMGHILVYWVAHSRLTGFALRAGCESSRCSKCRLKKRDRSVPFLFSAVVWRGSAAPRVYDLADVTESLRHGRHCPIPMAAMGRSRCRIQPGRSYPRPPRSKPHLHMSYKGALS